MKVDKYSARVAFKGENGEHLSVSYDNRGEPYREGITLQLNEDMDRFRYASVFLEEREVKELRDLLNTLYPKVTR